MSRQNPWFAQRTLRFRCTGCGDCCRQGGALFLYRHEADRIAQHLVQDDSASADTFAGELWTEEADGRFVIEVDPVVGCPFLKEDACSIHEIKPVQCRTYPFWPENLQSEKTWIAEKAYCEGIGPQGDPYRAPDIVALLKEQQGTKEN